MAVLRKMTTSILFEGNIYDADIVQTFFIRILDFLPGFARFVAKWILQKK